ncbi:la-related protein 6B-like [Rhodamnia argentea]|uniref:La-related protein 6B-like n=1 Tax=Rhodamnia argentea TaxID=178133 RepID=A0ABM3GTS9_9MYRT|nr:la-related protein 6B-like [Rhodamnia argentea]
MAEESPDPQPHSPASSSSSDPTLARSGSFSLLSARAPKFDITPRASSSRRPDLHPPPHHRLSIPPPPPPAALHHVDPLIPNSLFHLLPMQDHFPHPHALAVQYHHHRPPPHHPHNQHRGAHQDAIMLEGRGDQPNLRHTQIQAPAEQDEGACSKNGLSDEAVQKVLNQVEYYFSDIHLATTDHLMRFISNDPEGYVPIAVVASFKKIKALITSNSQLSSILQNSSKLVVSEDGKKVKRRYPLIDSDVEELQSRVVIGENLPEDHCHQNLMKLFSAVGSPKAIRIRQPQASYGGASSALRSGKADGMHYTNKLHAFVEYESADVAEKAVSTPSINKVHHNV